MQINADFSMRAVVHGARQAWVPSPMPGVERRMLDRIGDEVARATSIVRYAPGSAFSPHVHEGGEEYLVLEGVFQDEYGDFPAGTYVRNPPQSRHTPRSEEGAIILVKLWQFEPSDRLELCVDSTAQTQLPVEGRPGVRIVPLYQDPREVVRIEHWDPGAEVALTGHKGLEVFVVSGSFTEAGEEFALRSWLRLPVGAPLQATAGSQGAQVWIKADHLAEKPQAPG